MGNLWSSSKIRPVNGTYLEDRPRRPQRVASFIPIIEAPVLRVVRHNAPVPYKDKARRIIHEVTLRREALNRRIVG